MYVYSFWIDTKLYHVCVYCLHLYVWLLDTVPITRSVRNICKINDRRITYMYVFFLHSYAVYIVYHIMRVHLYIL